jgi:hypothetical protein
LIASLCLIVRHRKKSGSIDAATRSRRRNKNSAGFGRHDPRGSVGSAENDGRVPRRTFLPDDRVSDAGTCSVDPASADQSSR